MMPEGVGIFGLNTLPVISTVTAGDWKNRKKGKEAVFPNEREEQFQTL